MVAKGDKEELGQGPEHSSTSEPNPLVSEESEESVELDEPDESSSYQRDEVSSHSNGKEANKEGDSKEPVVQKSTSFKKKWVVFVVLALGLIAGGFYASTRVEKIKATLRAEEKVPMISNPVVVEKLAPFFILFESRLKDASAIMAKLDISVKWKRIVGIRFNESRYQIRADIYKSLKKLLSKGSDPRKDKEVIKDIVSEAVNRGLGISDVQITSLDIELI